MIFAGATSLASLYELIHPVLSSLEKINPEDPMIEYKALSYFVFFLLGLLMAPLLLPSTIVPSLSTKFKGALLLALTK